MKPVVRRASLSFLLVALVPMLGTAAKRPVDLPVHSTFADVDAQGSPYTLQSDGLGAYANGVDQVVSVLMANVFNNLYNGDWEMDASASAVRKVAITLAPANAVPVGFTGYTVAPQPPFWGTALVPARVIDKCTAFNKSVLTMAAGASITCPVVVHWDANGSYRLLVGTPNDAPETTPAQITCNAVDAGGCTDWFLDPAPAYDGNTGPVPGAIARLVSVAKNGANTNLGDFYVSFHFHVTRP